MSGNKQQDFYPGDVPARPGVYVFRDRFGKVIYVGKAANLRKRVSQYFQPSRSHASDPKVRSLIKSITNWEVYPVKNEDESLILESRLIKQYAPRYNVLMRDDKRYLLIRIDLNEDYPRLKLARVRKDDGCRYFGPFPKGGMLRPTIDFLTRYFRIRSCKSTLPTEHDRKHCLAKNVRDCCEPCIGKVSREEYHARVAEMIKVLDGSIKELVANLKDRMETAAKETKFELAAKWRDMVTNIEEVFGGRNRSFRFAKIPSATGEEAVKDLQDALKLSSPPSSIEGFDISNIGGQLAVGSMVNFVDGKPNPKGYRRFRIRDVHQIDDFAMMHEVINRHFKRKLDDNRPLPGLVLIDGGKGQLSAALQALVKLKCPPFPIIGLAKKQEEIFLPGQDKPLVLNRNRPALKLLQALRDEAHRFAVNYHRGLRSRRIQESLLDDIPGIGDNRKQAILKAFGSIRKLRKATPEEIAEKIPGIGTQFAKTIHDYLRKS